jgi:translation elongation factor EF-1beta
MDGSLSSQSRASQKLRTRLEVTYQEGALGAISRSLEKVDPGVEVSNLQPIDRLRVFTVTHDGTRSAEHIAEKVRQVKGVAHVHINSVVAT